MSAETFFQHYRNNNFFFSNKLLSKYCLSLYTKPFVILSGISGTGKTKIAQLFETFDAPVAVEAVPKFDYIIMNITPTVYAGDRGNLKFSDLRSVFEEDEIQSIEEKIEKQKKKGGDDNITDPEVFTIESDEGEFKVGIYLQRASNPLLRVRLKSRRGDAEKYDASDFIKKNFASGQVLKLEKIGKRRLRVATADEAGVKKVNEGLETIEAAAVNNKLFVAVKSNWTDSSELMGHYNLLDETYNTTPLLKFILTAHEYPEKPFFVILDEMNLSRVEHYFSDFLSCIESRVVVGGNIVQEKIRLHNYFTSVESNDNYFEFIPNSIEIPNNLYVTGTVNIDETTYSFSPKVLDRANVIEFNEVTLKSYEADTQNERFSLTTFPKFGQAGIATADAYSTSPKAYKDCVQQLLDILQPYNLHFGYRVINEMAVFINNSIQYINPTEEVIADAIDIQICQKVLPKFNGAFGKLDEPVRKLIQFMVGEGATDYMDINIDYVGTIDPGNTKFPESLSKLCKFYNNLIYNGFASFLE